MPTVAVARECRWPRLFVMGKLKFLCEQPNSTSINLDIIFTTWGDPGSLNREGWIAWRGYFELRAEARKSMLLAYTLDSEWLEKVRRRGIKKI